MKPIYVLEQRTASTREGLESAEWTNGVVEPGARAYPRLLARQAIEDFEPKELWVGAREERIDPPAFGSSPVFAWFERRVVFYVHGDAVASATGEIFKVGFTDVDQVEHQIECHADTLPEAYRQAMAALEKVHQILNDAIPEIG